MSGRSRETAGTGKERLYPLPKGHTTQVTTSKARQDYLKCPWISCTVEIGQDSKLWTSDQYCLLFLDNSSNIGWSFCQDPDTVLIRVESMIESTTDDNEFRSKDGTVVRIPDTDFNITPRSVINIPLPSLLKSEQLPSISGMPNPRPN
ncbi:hypothetical protein TNCV_150711 [Trichonephila clavipes]|nr:hypothetical protein TNCV_150711 [Trichonephila clavipes]